MTTSFDDLAAIEAVARSVTGVQEAASVVDRRLAVVRSGGPTTVSPTEPGHPVPGTVPAFARGAAPRVSADAPSTIGEVLLRAARDAPTRGTSYFLPDGTIDRQSYSELLDDALRILGGLARTGLRPGDPVLVHHTERRAFVTTWWACVLGGFIPTPVATAHDYGGSNAAVRRLRAAWQLLDRPIVVTDDGQRDAVAGLAGPDWSDGERLRVASVSDLAYGAPAEPVPALPDGPALNLLTSGSTGTPKCVHHTHRSIVARTHAAIVANGFSADEVSLNWMPLDHVGGMVMSNLRDTFLGCEQVDVPTELVVRRPLTWIDLADRYRVTATWAPNFAFALVNKHEDEINASSWDLSCLRNICNAGEPVVPGTARRFLELLTPHGLPPDAMVPCWGMSETSSGVTYSRMDAGDVTVGTITLDPASLGDTLIERPYGSPRSITVSAVGRPIPGVAVRIVDDAGEILPEGRVGQLHASGTTIMQGYLQNDGANAASFTADGWFDTGDLGFLRAGELFLTGRQKHMVIVNGLNYPAHEIEAVVERVPGVRAAHSAVCAVREEGDDTDGVVVFFVPREDAVGELDSVLVGIRSALAADVALQPRHLVPITGDEFPRAAGGKVQRDELVTAMREGRFDSRLFPGNAIGLGPYDHTMLEQVWKPVPAEPSVREGTVSLCYAPRGGAGPTNDGPAIIVHASAFRVVAPRHVEADLTDAAQHAQALACLRHTAPPGRVLYATEAGNPWPGDDEASPTLRLATTLALLAKVMPEADVTVLTADTLGVEPEDLPLPPRGTLPALVRTARAEALVSSIRLVDAPDAGELVLRPQEIPYHRADVVAIRDDIGYTRALRRVGYAERFDVPTRFLAPGGIVLLTGGLGGLGRIVAEHLLVAIGARVLIVGRTREDDLAGTDRGDVLAHLCALGEVRYAVADAADPDALSGTVAEAEQAWGASLDLVIHLASTPVAPQWSQLSAHGLRHETPGWIRQMLRPKLGGGEAVDRLLRARPDASVVLFSSVNGFLGGSGFGAYSAANSALDAFAHRWTARGHTVRCIAWSMWAGPGMNDGSPLVPAAQQRGLRLLDTAEGLALLLAALHQPATLLLAGVDAANPHIALHLADDEFVGSTLTVAVVPQEGIEPDRLRRDVGAALAAGGRFVRVTTLGRLPLDARGVVDPVAVLSSRSDNGSEYSAPVGAAEETIARITAELLQIRQVGRDDSFFALGCDSIRAAQLVEQIGAALGQDVPVGRLYEGPTVRRLAAAIA